MSSSEWRQTTLPRFFHHKIPPATAVTSPKSAAPSGAHYLQNLGVRSKSQDAIRNHRKTVRFVADHHFLTPSVGENASHLILESTSSPCSRPKNFRLNGINNNNNNGSGKNRSFFLLSMLQGGDQSSSSGRAKSSKVSAFLYLLFWGRVPSVTLQELCFGRCIISVAY